MEGDAHGLVDLYVDAAVVNIVVDGLPARPILGRAHGVGQRISDLRR